MGGHCAKLQIVTDAWFSYTGSHNYVCLQYSIHAPCKASSASVMRCSVRVKQEMSYTSLYYVRVQ